MLLPARAGMIPGNLARIVSAAAAPRTRGDDPDCRACVTVA